MTTAATRRLLSLSSHLVRPTNSTATLRRARSNPNPKQMSTLSASAPPPPFPTEVTFNFELSKNPKNTLGEGKCIRTAAALIIGYVHVGYPPNTYRTNKLMWCTYVRAGRDEILNGKTLDRNSNYFARYCFEQGIELYVPFCLKDSSPAFCPMRLKSGNSPIDLFYRKRVEVIADDEAEIIEASRRMVQNYDFVVTSGGIGPTHDGSCLNFIHSSLLRCPSHHPWPHIQRYTSSNYIHRHNVRILSTRIHKREPRTPQRNSMADGRDEQTPYMANGSYKRAEGGKGEDGIVPSR